MNIICRNFFRLIKAGAFYEYEQLEPMSVFKWNSLLTILNKHRALTLAEKALEDSQFDTSLLPRVFTDKVGEMSEAAPGIDFGLSHLANTFLDKRLDCIRSGELHAIDTSTEKIEMLDILVFNIHALFTTGITFGFIVSIGQYLRYKGEKVDFVKLDNWLSRLHLRQIAQFEGSILITTLDFDQNEIPFVKQVEPSSFQMAYASLDSSINDMALENLVLTQSALGIVTPGNPRAILHNLSHCMKFFRFAPIETTSIFLSNISNSLAKIDE